MSPARPSTRRNSSGGFKPYTRGGQAQTASINATAPHSGSGSGNSSISPSGVTTGNTGNTSPVSARHSSSPAGAHNVNSNSPPYTPHTPLLNTSPPHRTSIASPPLQFNTPPPYPPPPSHIADRPGFPSYAQYKQVEAAYLSSLTPRRQGKALISQRMFDRIWDVLHQPDAPGETAQFRFWARKMFTVRTVGGAPRGAGAPGGMMGGGGGTGMGIGETGAGAGPPTAAGFADAEPQEVLLHDGLLVAIQEQLYDLLCYCHGSTGHGGRDKTCALVRKHYTWVPKDLVSSFIKACPTCILKKCGHGGGVGMNLSAGVGANVSADSQQRRMEQQIQMQQIQQRQEEHQRLQMHQQHQQQQHHAQEPLPLPGMRDFFQNMYGMDFGAPSSSAPSQGVPWPTMGDGHVPASEQDGTMSPAAMSMSMSLSLSMSGSGSGSRSGSVGNSANDSGSGTTPGLGSGPGSLGSAGSASTHEEDPLALDGAYHEAVLRARNGNENGKPHLQGRGAYPTHPMVREVALYKGLPNGWQYRHADYASAHAEFMATKDSSLSAVNEHAEHTHGMDMQMYMVMDGPGMQRPRVPSILPLWGPDKFTQPEYEAVAAGNAAQLQGLSPVLPGNGNHNTDNTGRSPVLGGMDARADFSSGTQQMSLQYLLMNAPKDAAAAAVGTYTPQIDPVLLGYSATAATTGSGSSPPLGAASTSARGADTGSGSGVSASEFVDSASATLGSSTRFPSSPSIKRAAAAPLRIHLEFPPPEKSFQALLAYRDSLDDGNLTPDSPLLGWVPGGASGSVNAGEMYVPNSSGPPSLAYPASPSPSLRSDGSAGSGGSQLSQLSAFRVSLADDAGPVSNVILHRASDGGDGRTPSGTSHSNDSTPASSALPTPVDEYGSSAASAAAAVDIEGKRKMEFNVAETQTRLEKELSEGIQIVLGLQNSTTA